MKKLCSDGFNISNADQKALDHYLLQTPYWKIGSYFGVAQQTISNIINRKRWEHI